jgi:putative transposase
MSKATSHRAATSVRGKPIGNRRSGDRPVGNSRPFSSPPYNPGLQQLVEGKQAWAAPPDTDAGPQGFLGWHQRGYLPHRDAPGLTQFVTFRLHDSLPVGRRGEWEALLRIEEARQRRIQLEDYLDHGHGECWLRQPAIAGLTEGALRHFDGSRYELLAWVVMPNHVHVLLRTWRRPLASVVQSWKRFVAREANKLLGREGAFWEREYWDTYMRDEEQAVTARRYTEQNPVEARLVREPKDWAWSSARLRDAHGRLVLPEDDESRLQVGAPHGLRSAELNSA